MDRAMPAENVVLSVIARACRCDVATLSSETVLHDLEIDSLKMVSIVSQIEAAYGCEFGTEEIIDFFMAEKIADLIALMGLSP
jgi:acyl carrier protein